MFHLLLCGEADCSLVVTADNGANTTLASSPLLFLERFDFSPASSSMRNGYQLAVAHLVEEH